MSLIENERAKLTANWLNAMGSGVIITGVVAPSIAVVFGAAHVSIAIVLASAAVWLSSGILLHFMARRVLGRLKP